MKDNKQDLVRVLLGESVARTPIWLMRQAGRYLPEYRELRAKAGSFLNLCTNPKLAAEITMQPLARFNLDAAIIFSDILTIPYVYGMGLEFLEKQGPCFKDTINTLEHAKSLPDIDIQKKLGFVLEAITLVRTKLNNNIPLIGFAGSPWTVATYMVEGQTSKSFSKIKQMLYADPIALHTLLEKLANDTIEYALLQIAAGADVFMLFDTWGNILAKPAFLQFSLKYLEKIVATIKQQYPNIPVILFCKNGGKHLEEIKNTGCNAVGLDWTASIRDAKQQLNSTVTMQGNLDPTVLYGSFATITAEVERILAEVGNNYSHVFNLGHGILPDIEPAKVEHLVNQVHSLSVKYHANKERVV